MTTTFNTVAKTALRFVGYAAGGVALFYLTFILILGGLWLLA